MSEASIFTMPVDDLLIVTSAQGKEVLCMKPDGRIFWRGREVETDEDLRSAMLDMAETLKRLYGIHKL